MWFDIQNEYIELFINARPASSKNEIVGIFDDTLKIKIKAPAVEGAANKELIKFLSKQFKVSKSDIEIVSGTNSKRKKIKMPINQNIKEFIDERKSI